MTYTETLDFLYQQLPMYQRIGAPAFKKDLTNTLALCEHLGNPHKRLRCLHIAGTNGKGTVSHMLAAMAQAAGMRTGLYISPHYKDFRERIKVNGQYISKKAVVAFVQENLKAIQDIQPSFFELTVAMAFHYFAQRRVDIAVIEVGLGGRLDSTNVLLPALSVITNISFDHMDMLGDTLPLIAAEKAGIIKPGIPVVVGETHPDTLPVFEAHANRNGAPLYIADQLLRSSPVESEGPGSSVFDVSDGQQTWRGVRVDGGGPFLEQNLRTAFQAWRLLPDIPESAMREGLEHLRERTRYMGRWQFIRQSPPTLVDSAHNEAGLMAAFKRIQTMPYRQLHVVTGTVGDKDLNRSLPCFPVNATYYFAKANIPRGMDAAVLRAKAAGFGLQGRAYSSVRNALAAAHRAAAPDDLVVVIGSVFVAAEVL